MSLKLECNSNQEKYTQPGCGFHFCSNVFFYFYWLSSIFAFACLPFLFFHFTFHFYTFTGWLWFRLWRSTNHLFHQSKAIAFTQKRFAMAVNTMRYSAIVYDTTQHAMPCNYISHQTSAIAFTQKRFAMARNAIPSILSAILFSPTAAAAAYLGAVIV